MGQTRIQMFEQQEYPPIFASTAESTIRHFEEHHKQITQEWKKLLAEYMEQLADLQENGSAEEVGEIDISFLYTSLEEGHPQFQVDSYGEFGRAAGKSILGGYLPGDWLTIETERLEAQLEQRVKEEGLRGYVRAAEIETLKLRAVRSLLYFFALRFKYTIQEMLDLRRLAKIRKAPNFLIQIGEYMDWQKTIYAVLPVVDIFNCEQTTDLRFRSFLAVYYQDKVLKNLNLSQSSFKDCTFENSRIVECIMNDCTFDGCTFTSAATVGTKMAGCTFINCTFRQTEFEETVFDRTGTAADSIEYYEPAEFYDCNFQSLMLKKCSFEGCVVENCDADALVIENSSTEGTDFAKLLMKNKSNDEEGEDELL